MRIPQSASLTYWLLVASFITAAVWQRFSFPILPFSDPDTWGYLSPAVSLFTDGEFIHTYGRHFVYPGFIYVLLSTFGTFNAIAVVQHLLGIASGLLLLASWNRLPLLVPFEGKIGHVHRFLGPFLMGSFLLSGKTIEYEHSVRPEAVFPIVAAIVVYCLLRFLELARSDAKHSWKTFVFGGLLLFTAYLLYFVKSQSVLLVALMPILVLVVAIAARLGVRCSALIIIVPSILAVVTFWIPEKHFSTRDSVASRLLPSRLLIYHMDLVVNVLSRDTRDPEYEGRDKRFLEELVEAFETEVEKFQSSSNPTYRTLGFDPGALFYGEMSEILTTRFRDDEESYRKFCYRSFFRAVADQPIRYIRKVGRQLGLFYSLHPTIYYNYTAPVGRHLEYSYESLQSYSEALERYEAGREYLKNLKNAKAVEPIPFGFRILGWLYYYYIGHLYLPMLLVALILGGWLAVDRIRARRRGESGDPLLIGLGGLALLFAVFVFAMNLASAAAHTLEVKRFIFLQQILVLFSQFTTALFLVASVTRPIGERVARSGDND